MGSLTVKKTPEGIVQQLLNFVLKPHWIVLVTVSLSALAWLTPDYFGFYKGFDEAESINLFNLLFVFSWYFLAIFFSYLAFNTGTRFSRFKELNQYANINRDHIYYLYSLVGLFGLLYTIYVTFQVLGFSGFIYSIVTFSTNRISEAIYYDYSVGIFSLRYVTIITFGWALYRVIILKRIRIIDLLNIILFLFYIAFFGRRLQLVCSVLIFLSLANRYGALLKKLKLSRIIILIAAGFIMISVATLLRNYGSYADMGYSNPFAAVITNIISYLAAPFQVSLAIGNNILEAFGGLNYRYYTDVDRTLTANSAYADLAVLDGVNAIFKMLFWSIFFGFLAGWFYKNKENYTYTAYPVILYAFAELWRIDLFSKGIFFTLLAISAGIPIFYAFTVYLFKPSKNIVEDKIREFKT